jgi:hypothetical protein
MRNIPILESTEDYPALRAEIDSALDSGGSERPIYRLCAVEKGKAYTLCTHSESVLRTFAQISEESMIVLCRAIAGEFRWDGLAKVAEFIFDVRPGVSYKAKLAYSSRWHTSFFLEPIQVSDQ